MGLRKSDYITGAVGLLTGGPLGAFFSLLVFRGVKKIWLWGLIGVIAGPATWISTATVFGLNGSDTSAPISTSQSNNDETPAPVSTSKNKDSPAPSAEPQAEFIPLGTKEQVRDDRALSVSGSEVYESIASSNDFMDPIESKGGKLIAVFMTIENTGKESGDMTWTTFQLEDSNGNKYDDIEDFTEMVTLSTWAKENGLEEPGDQLFPGGTAKTAAIFRVSKDAENLRLVVNKDKIFAIK